nr:PKD domain-containing protein [uncultured Psychroserpens sp.]
MKNKINIFRKTTLLVVFFIATSLIVGCTLRDDLPDANSKADTVPPEANFSYASDSDDFRTINFTNLSSEATTFAWDFGGGATSDMQDPSHTFEAGEGTYSVTLTASDELGAVNTITIDVMVVEGPFQPIILEAGFEDDTLPGGGGDGRDSWRNSDLGGVIQITGSPVTFGDQGAKLPLPAGDRIGYQEITVEPDTNYDLRFYYTMLDNSSSPSLTVAVLGVTEFGSPENTQEALDASIASVTVTDDSEPDVYVQSTLTFNSGINNTVAIYFYNGPVEARLDDFTIDVAPEGAVPPSAGFSSAQSETNYLEYTFNNTSTGATSYLWDFGDGNTSTEESPTHVYDTHDVYTVTLTATNDANLSTSLSQTIDIQAPVTADFTYMVDEADYRTYEFMDASEGAVMLLWEFGDGFQFTGMDPSHTYSEDGIYTVTLTATSITGSISVATEELVVAEGFVVQVLNGTFDLYGTTAGCDGESTGDNADAWDMTPNSTIKDCDGNDIPSPYDPLWDNGALDSWLDTFYGDNSEQAGSTSEGNNGTRGAKLDEPGRRLYQVVTVQAGETYTFSIDAKGDTDGLTPEVFILNTEIADEMGINASTSDPAIDAYYEIAATTSYDTYTFDFTASTNEIVIYVRTVVGSARFDNIEITD